MAKITIGEKEYNIRELKYGEVLRFSELPKEEVVKQTVITATGITEEDFEELSLKDGITLSREVDKVNSLPEDFRTPLKD